MEGRPRLRPRNGRRRRERPAEIASRRQARTQGLHRLFLPHQNLDPRRLTQQLSPGQCFRYWLGGTPKARRNIAANPLGLSYPTSRSEEHTSELQSLMRNSYAVFCLKKKKTPKQ